MQPRETLLIYVADNVELSGLKFHDEDSFVMEKGFARYISPGGYYNHIRKSNDTLIYFNPTGKEEGRKI